MMKKKLQEEENKLKKNLALKVKSEEGDSSMDKQDMSLLSRKFNNFLSRSKGKNFTKSKCKKDSDNEIICYKCGKVSSSNS